MNEKPILFSTAMVQALLQGRKTQTRRIVKPQPDNDEDGEIGVGIFNPALVDSKGELYPGPDTFGAIADSGEYCVRCPYGQSGDKLYVREMWQWEGDTKWSDAQPIGSFWYKADEGRVWEQGPARWKPSIHMPKAAARIWLEVEQVRVERLQDISWEDAIAEGVMSMEIDLVKCYRDYGGKPYEDTWVGNPIISFETLWASINGPENWEQNPFVWVIKFRRL